jgi:hypothetical protein
MQFRLMGICPKNLDFGCPMADCKLLAIGITFVTYWAA